MIKFIIKNVISVVVFGIVMDVLYKLEKKVLKKRR